MGVIFSKSESSQFISNCQANLTGGLEVVNDLKSGNDKLMQAIDGKTLSGAAYNAGKGLFGELIIPTMTRCGQAIEEMSQDLQRYISANQAIQAASTDTLDEAKLEQKIRESETYRNTTKMTADALSSQAFDILAMTNPVTAMLSLANHLFDIQGKLNSYVASLDQDIEKLKQDLRLLQNFVSETQGLFSNSLTNFKIAMQGVTVLGKLIVYSDGTYRFPKGMDKSWFTKIQKNPKEALKNSSTNAYLDLYKEVEKLLKPVKNGKNDNIKRIEMLLKAYPANVVKKLLENDEFWLLASKLPNGAQTKLISGLAKFEWLGQAVSQGKWLPKIDTLGKAYENLNKITSPVKTFVGEGLKKSKFIQGAKTLGKVATVATYAQLGITFVSSGIDEYGKTGSIGKGIIGGGIETIKSIGPLEGMTLLAPLGPVGMGVGAFLGTANVVAQLINPNLYDDIKDGAYKLYDKGKEAIGKGVSQGIDTVKSACKNIQNVGKSIGNALGLPKIKLGW